MGSLVHHASFRVSSSDRSADRAQGSHSITKSLPRACPQSGDAYTVGMQSEDCLYATVYAPARAESDSGLPVLVW